MSCLTNRYKDNACLMVSGSAMLIQTNPNVYEDITKTDPVTGITTTHKDCLVLYMSSTHLNGNYNSWCEIKANGKDLTYHRDDVSNCLGLK